MNIFHNSRKIGYAHTRLEPHPGGSELLEQVWMRVTTMGMAQELRLQTRARLLADLSLERLEFELASGPFRFRAEAEVAGDTLTVHTETAGVRRRVDLPLKRKPFLPCGRSLRHVPRAAETRATGTPSTSSTRRPWVRPLFSWRSSSAKRCRSWARSRSACASAWGCAG